MAAGDWKHGRGLHRGGGRVGRLRRGGPAQRRDGAKVVLLEAGPPDRDPFIHIPAGVLRVLNNAKINWNYLSEGEPGTAGRQLQWPRGKTLGGTSSINGMLYVRGNPADYDNWAQMGCRGWSYDEVLPFFKKSETYRGDGDPEYRSRGGPLIVEDYRTILPLTHGFVEAAKEAGFPYTPDYNGRQQEGVAYSQMTRRGRLRGSTARTFLAEARHRANLKVETDAIATRLLFEGKRCVGVAFRQNGVDRQLRAAREVIVSGGAVNSPHLLQISGIGPANHLQAIGVPVVHDLPGVGANLNDHYVVRISHRVRDAVTINQLARGLRLAREVARWATVGDGALTFGVTSAMVFCRSREGLSSPDLQLLFTPASYAQGVFRQLEREPGMTVAVCPVRPESRGTIMAQSPDPLTYPAIRPNYLSAPSDLRVLISRHPPYPHASSPSRRWRGTASRRPCRGRASRPTSSSASSPATPAPTCSTRSAPARWAPTRWRWSIRASGSTASTGCGSSTPRSCRR